MGWAKYTEDNLEIILERLYMMEHHMVNTELKNSFATQIVSETKNVAEMKEGPRGTIATNHDCKFEDTYIVCKDCGRKFSFSALSQKRFASNGWEKPKRCKRCRDFRNTRYLMCASF